MLWGQDFKRFISSLLSRRQVRLYDKVDKQLRQTSSKTFTRPTQLRKIEPIQFEDAVTNFLKISLVLCIYHDLKGTDRVTLIVTLQTHQIGMN